MVKIGHRSGIVPVKKKISVIALNPRAGASYRADIAGLFAEEVDISVFSVQDGSAAGVLNRADLFVTSTDVYVFPEEPMRHIPVDSQAMAVEVSFRWSELRRLKKIPAGSQVLFVNLTQTVAREVAINNYSFDRMFARSIRLERQFHILMESLEDGVMGRNEKGDIFACSRHAEEMTCVGASLVQGRRCEEVFPYIPFVQCLQSRQTLPAWPAVKAPSR